MSSRWIKVERAVRLLKFLAAGLPSFMLALPANYWLVDRLGLAKPLAYAIVLLGQLTLNFLLNRTFVFEKRGGSLLREFGPFVVGILGFRVADWLVFVVLVDICGLYYLAVQLGNILVFSVPKFVFAEHVFRARGEQDSLSRMDSLAAIVRNMVMDIGRLKLLSIIILIACLLSTRFVGPFGKKLILRLLLGVVFLTFLLVQGRSVLDTYSNTNLYQRRNTMALSDLQIVDRLYDSRRFSGRDVLLLLVADYMPRAKVFLYDENLYSKEALSWSGRDLDTTFTVGGYQPSIDDSFRVACLARSHILYKGRSTRALYITTPLSTYEKEERVFLMKDELMDYLIPGSWRVSQH
jgi:putative flippase GtrA